MAKKSKVKPDDTEPEEERPQESRSDRKWRAKGQVLDARRTQPIRSDTGGYR